MKLEDVILRGDRASQPAANAVPIGTLYCITDEDGIVERSTGVVWEFYSPTGVSLHAVSHENGGLDEISLTGLSGLLADSQTPLAHKTSHQNGGSDEVSVTGLSGLLADAQTPLTHKTSHENGGSDEVSVAGLSGLLADAQTPLNHATSHQSGGGDVIKLDDLAAPDDNTDLNASAFAHGLLDKLPGGTTAFKRADGAWATPPGSAGGGGGGSADIWWPAFTAPVNGDFAWINQGGASVDTTYGGIYLSAPATGTFDLRIRKKAAPATPWVLTACYLTDFQTQSNPGCGLLFRQSSDGKLVTFSTWAIGNLIEVDNWTDPANVAASPLSVTWYSGATNGLRFLRIADDGVNRICSISADGHHWRVMSTIARTNFLTADEIGFWSNSSNATWDAGMLLLSWQES